MAQRIESSKVEVSCWQRTSTLTLLAAFSCATRADMSSSSSLESYDRFVAGAASAALRAPSAIGFRSGVSSSLLSIVLVEGRRNGGSCSQGHWRGKP